MAKKLIKEIRPYVKLYRDTNNGIAWIEDGSTGLGISVHPNLDYQKLFLQRWKELENEIELEKEDGETSFLEKDIFFKFFTSPELLVGYYVWRESGNLEYAYELFMDEYDDWVNDCKDIAFKAKAVFEEHIKQ